MLLVSVGRSLKFDARSTMSLVTRLFAAFIAVLSAFVAAGPPLAPLVSTPAALYSRSSAVMRIL